MRSSGSRPRFASLELDASRRDRGRLVRSDPQTVITGLNTPAEAIADRHGLTAVRDMSRLRATWAFYAACDVIALRGRENAPLRRKALSPATETLFL
jgi:hypothetical protein